MAKQGIQFRVPSSERAKRVDGRSAAADREDLVQEAAAGFGHAGRRVAVLFPPAYNRFPNNFSHIFGGGYAAGYYSYKWAEVLSADAFSAFEEMRDGQHGPRGVIDPAIGARFREEVLAVGGSRPAADSFRAFRGREPRVEALLKHSGMIAA